MDVREKMFTLFQDCNNPSWKWFPNNAEMLKLIDYLIAHGVTVQEWISLSEQKPGRDDLVLVFFEGMRDTNCAIQVMYGWCVGGSASYWMPLPQPPKGE